MNSGLPTQQERSDRHLYALMLKLRARAAGDILPNAGQMAHAALLSWLREVDAELAERLHEPNADRPFTCSSLWFPNAREVEAAQRTNRRLPIVPEQTYWLRLTLLDDTLFRTLTSRFLRPVAPVPASNSHSNLGLPSLRLGAVRFDIAELVATDARPEASGSTVSWAGYASYAGLVARARAVDGASTTVRSIGIEFRSPTAFSDGQVAWGKRMHLFPDPERVFGRLARVWNQWAPMALALNAQAIQEYSRDWVAVARHDLRTHMFHFDRHTQVGFVGQCVYRLMDVDFPSVRRAGGQASTGVSAAMAPLGPRGHVLHGEEPPPPPTVGAGLTAAQSLYLLASFAFFSGIGHKTAMGMGQARPLSVAASSHPADAAAQPAASPASVTRTP